MVDKTKQDVAHLEACFIYSNLSYANRLKVGEMIVSPAGVQYVGVNGTAPGTPNECEYTDENGKLVTHPYVICGAANAVYKAVKHGGSGIEGSTLYSTDSPCPKCTHALISMGIKRVVYVRQYRLIDHLHLLTDAGVSVEQIQIPFEHLLK